MQVNVGDLVVATGGRIAGQMGLVTELRQPHKLGRFYKLEATIAVLWRSGEHQRWINPKFLKKVVDKLDN